MDLLNDLSSVATRANQIGNNGIIRTVYGQLASYSGKVPAELYSAGISGVNELIAATEERQRRYSNNEISTLEFYGNASKAELASLQDRIGGNLAAANTLTSEITRDVTTAENLLGVLESSLQAQLDIKNSAKATAENTKKLDLLDPRKLSFIDLVRNSVFSQGLKVDFQKVQLPTAVSSTILASSASPAVPSDTLAAMRRMVDLMDEANDYLAVIAENTNKNSTDDVDISDNRLIGRINSIKGRSIS